MSAASPLPVALADITGRDFSISAAACGQVVENLADIDQCIRVILATPKGSRPHQPLFGCDAWRYLDAPLPESVAHIIREVAEAVALWEPRCRVKSVTPDYGALAAGALGLRLEWTLPGYDQPQTTEVR